MWHENSKVESHCRAVKTLCTAILLARTAQIDYFCTAMRTFLSIAYWLAAIALLSAILVSLDYTLAQAVLIGLMFCPCALTLEYFMPKARKPMDKVYLSLAVLVTVVLLILILHQFVWTTITQQGYARPDKAVAPMLINPAFLALILTAVSIGDYFWAKWVSARFKGAKRTITFFSERKSVTLALDDIAYVESNDTEVRIVTPGGESYRNKTGIGQWENLLGNDFLRIHRSYLVNLAKTRLASPDAVDVCGIQLPVSRKYKDNVMRHRFGRTE